MRGIIFITILLTTIKRFENFPLWIVFLSNLVSLIIYVLGFWILIQTGLILPIVYVFYALILEYRLLNKHCINCYYYGKTCGFGRGRVSSWLFKKGDISEFCAKKFSWKDIIPDLLISLVPFLIGIVLLILNFSFTLLAAVVLLSLLTTLGNSFVRGRLTCRHCRQKELGCPAYLLFNKEKVK